MSNIYDIFIYFIYMYCLYISVQRVFDGSMNPDEGMVAIFS